MKNILILSLCLGLTFTGPLPASNQREFAEDGKPRVGLPPAKTKEIILSGLMDKATVDLYTKDGKPAGIKIPLIAHLGISSHVASLDIRLAEGADWRNPYLSKHLADMKHLTSLAYTVDILHGCDLAIIGRCTSLTGLSLTCNVLFDETSGKVRSLHYIEGLTKLKNLNLAFHNSVDNCRYLESLAKLPNLSSLTMLHTFNHQHPLYPCGGTDCLEQLTQLSRLSLKVSNPADELSLIYPSSQPDREKLMRRPLMALTHCDLSFCEGDVDHQLQCFVPDSPHLEELHLTSLEHTANIKEEGYDWLKRSKSLKILQLNNIAVSDQVLELACLSNLLSLQMNLHKDYMRQGDSIRAAFRKKLPECELHFVNVE
jgi:hypothetical protein